MSPFAQAGRKLSSVDAAYEIERAFSPPLFKSPRDEGGESYFAGPSWESEHLRPRLLPSPRRKSPRDRHHQHSQNEQERRLMTLNSAYSPPPNQETHGAIHSPTPSRPSSTLSLPLPSQMPFFAIPPVTFAPVSPLPHISEHVQACSSTMSPESDVQATSTSRSPPLSSLMCRRRSSSGSVNELASNLFRSEGCSSNPLRLCQPESLLSDSSSRMSTASTASSSLPPPTPPTIHSPPPSSLHPDLNTKYSDNEERKRAPYAFLNQAPPPNDAHLVTEMGDNEYRLIAKLPGFERDCIMVSTRKKRTLHIAADSWAPGGGHFEKRVTFDYDADLTRVRAEFDGEFLRIIVPRKDYRQSWFGSHSGNTSV